MKYKIGFFSFFCASVMSFTFSSKLDFKPPGTVEIVDNFFYDEREICNIDWKEYLSYIRQTDGLDSEKYQANLPDTTVWLEEGGFNQPLVETYFSHPSYDDYPVVGITHQQASNYCKWRTKVVKIMVNENGIKAPRLFEYRLPSQTEWALIANAGMTKKLIKAKKRREQKTDYPWKQQHEGKFKYKERQVVGEGDQNPFRGMTMHNFPGPALSYMPNKYGVYNIYGNVAEMVLEPGIAMGGSFEHYYDEVVPSNKVIEYEKAQKWLGFRCVCEILEK